MPGIVKPPLGRRINWSSPYASRLLAAYAFNEGAGTQLNCSVRPVQAGTISGATWVSTPYGPALDFAAGTNAVTCPQQGILAGMANLSVVMLLQLDGGGGGGFGRAVTLNDTSSYGILTDGGTGSSLLGSTNGSNFASGTSMGTAWRHVAITYDRTTRRIYFDGFQQASSVGALNINSSTADLIIGNRTGLDRGWDGRIGQLLIYDRELSAAEVRDLAANPWLPWSHREPEYFWYVAGVVEVVASLSATLGDATLASSVTRTTPSPAGAGLTQTLGAVTLASSVTSAAPAGSAATLAQTLGGVALTSSVTSAAPAGATGTLSATLGGVTLASSVTAGASGAVSGTLTQTLADATLTSAVVRTLPGNATANLGGAGDQITETFSGTLANWTEHSSYTSGDFAITAAGRLRTNSLNVGAIYHNTAPASADQDIRATLRVVSVGSGEQLMVAARMDTSANTMYYAGYLDGTGWVIRRLLSGGIATLASQAVTLTAGQDYALAFAVSGSSLTLQVDGVTVGTATDSNITAAGRVGVRAIRSASVGDANGLHLDDFRLIGSGEPVVLDAVTLASSVSVAVAGATASLTQTLGAVGLTSAVVSSGPGVAVATLAQTLGSVSLTSVVLAALTRGPSRFWVTTTSTNRVGVTARDATIRPIVTQRDADT